MDFRPVVRQASIQSSPNFKARLARSKVNLSEGTPVIKVSRAISIKEKSNG